MRRLVDENILSTRWFITKDGYTSISFVMALLVSLTLIFSSATSQWTMSKGQDIQYVADSAAVSGSATVNSYMKVVGVVDGVVLCLGTVGIMATAMGFVLCAIPGSGAAGLKVVDTSRRVLDIRDKFADRAYGALEYLEELLPGMITINSIDCIKANSTQSIKYKGCTIPYPLSSQSGFKRDLNDLDTEDVASSAKEIADISDKCYEYKKDADEAKLRGWLADCASDRCMRERAASLVGLSDLDNPDYPDIDKWTFGAPILRSRRYYEKRLRQEIPKNTSDIEKRRSRCRYYYYDYALDNLYDATYKELDDLTVEIDIPDLFSNTSEMKQTNVYDLSVWYVSDGVLHGCSDCSGIDGACSACSLRQAETSGYKWCSKCQMKVSKMGNVACASSHTDTGFEKWYLEVVDAAKDYEEACNKLAKCNKELDEATQSGAKQIEHGLDILSKRRPVICPAGAYGCIGVVVRDEGVCVPSELTQSFVGTTNLGSASAVSGSCLAKDTNAGISARLHEINEQLAASIGKGKLLSMLVDLTQRIFTSSNNTLDTQDLDEKFFEGVEVDASAQSAVKLRKLISNCISKSDIKLCKTYHLHPVLVNTSHICQKAGLNKLELIRSAIETMPNSTDPKDIAMTVFGYTKEFLYDKEIVIGEIDIAGIGYPIKIKIRIGDIFG